MENTHTDRFPPWKNRNLLAERLKKITGIDDVSGIQIASLLGILANIYDTYTTQIDEHSDITGPRWMVMMRLLDEESHGNFQGITPTMLSHARNVSKNTTSALIRGLEDQGLVERRLDKTDRRIFRICLTEKGRNLTKKISPNRFSRFNDLARGLKKDEREQLITLLERLIESMNSEGILPSMPF